MRRVCQGRDADVHSDRAGDRGDQRQGDGAGAGPEANARNHHSDVVAEKFDTQAFGQGWMI